MLYPTRARASRLATSCKPRNAVTLIELLIAIAIIATLSATFLGVSSAAMEQSRASRTKTLIAKIHTLLMERWESYAMRRVDVDTSGFTTPPTAKQRAGIRLVALRSLMRLEMPDRWSDILGDETVIGELVEDALPASITQAPATKPLPEFTLAKIAYPSLSRAYLRRYSNIKPSATVEDIENNQGAECLYMIIMLATGDGEARTLFNEQNIGDTDNDGAPEFLDGWGQPIHYLRWPAGFALAGLSSLMSADPDADHDPFDYFHVDNPNTTTGGPYLDDSNAAFRVFPLIYSAGSDRDPDLYTAKGVLILDPYIDYLADGINAKIGAPLDATIDLSNDGDNWLDNIHNHLQDNR